MFRRLLCLIRDGDGATAVEYAVMLALVLIVVMGAIGGLGSQTGGMWGGIETDLTAAGFGGS